MFQGDQDDHCKLRKELKIFTPIVLRRRIYLQNCNWQVNINFININLPIEKLTIVDFLNKITKTVISSTALKDIYEKCYDFFKSFCKYLFD